MWEWSFNSKFPLIKTNNAIQACSSSQKKKKDKKNLLMKWTNTKYINCPCLWNWDYKCFS